MISPETRTGKVGHRWRVTKGNSPEEIKQVKIEFDKQSPTIQRESAMKVSIQGVGSNPTK